MKTGTRVIVIPERTRVVDARTCDICGQDATDLDWCCSCHRDLCRIHQLYTHGRIERFWSNHAGIPQGNYCKECLLKAIEALSTLNLS